MPPRVQKVRNPDKAMNLLVELLKISDSSKGEEEEQGAYHRYAETYYIALRAFRLSLGSPNITCTIEYNGTFRDISLDHKRSFRRSLQFFLS